jgi:hypothetical protein
VLGGGGEFFHSGCYQWGSFSVAFCHIIMPIAEIKIKIYTFRFHDKPPLHTRQVTCKRTVPPCTGFSDRRPQNPRIRIEQPSMTQ